MPEVSVLIPYGPRSEWEERIFRYSIDRWKENFPTWEVILGDGGDPFNRSRARNDAASRASGDIYVVCDADTTFYSAKDFQIVVRLTTRNKWYLPTTYTQATESWTRGLLDGVPLGGTVESVKVFKDQPGGWRICHRKAYEAVGGFDEGFKGWGYEDTAFGEAMDSIVSPSKRGGAAVHLWHPTDRSQRQAQENIAYNRNRFSRYHRANLSGPPAMMRLLTDLGVT